MPTGDLLFYTSRTGKIADRTISFFTNSKFVHVAIDVGDDKKVEAMPQGIIAIHPYDPNEVAARWVYPFPEVPSLDTAIVWVESMVGKKYGWQDIFTQLNFLNKIFYIIKPGTYNCSTLAANFLIRAGGANLGYYWDDPHTATPGGLARQLGVPEP
jgi:uncharacterized protein YycO